MGPRSWREEGGVLQLLSGEGVERVVYVVVVVVVVVVGKQVCGV